MTSTCEEGPKKRGYGKGEELKESCSGTRRERENQCLRGSEVAKREKEATDG